MPRYIDYIYLHCNKKNVFVGERKREKEGGRSNYRPPISLPKEDSTWPEYDLIYLIQ